MHSRVLLPILSYPSLLLANSHTFHLPTERWTSFFALAS